MTLPPTYLLVIGAGLLILFLFLVFKALKGFFGEGLSEKLQNRISKKVLLNWVSDRWISYGVLFSGSAMSVILFFVADERIKLFAYTENRQYWARAALWTLFVIFAIVFLIVSLLEIGKKERLSKMSSEIKQLTLERDELAQDFDDTCKGLVVSLAEKLRFSSNGHPPKDRITIYSHDKDKFLAFGRYSINEKYAGKGNGPYNDSSGCIAKAWEDGHYFDNEFPDPSIDKEGYINRHKEYGLKKPQARSLRMPSRLYFGWRVRDTSGSRSLAVVLVESTDPNRWSQAELLDFFNHEKHSLREIMERLYKRLPKLTISEEEDL